MKQNRLEYEIYYLAHNRGLSIQDIKLMEVDEFHKWIEYFSITNGSGKTEKSDDNNVAGFMQFLQGEGKK